MTKNLQGNCQHCGAPLEFPAANIGLSSECPHCGKETELMLAALPESRSGLPTRAIVFVILAVVILVGGLIASQFALRRLQRMRSEPERPAPVSPSHPAKTPAR